MLNVCLFQNVLSVWLGEAEAGGGGEREVSERKGNRHARDWKSVQWQMGKMECQKCKLPWLYRASRQRHLQILPPFPASTEEVGVPGGVPGPCLTE